MVLLFTGCNNMSDDVIMDEETKTLYINCLENKSEIIREDYKYCIETKAKNGYSLILETCRTDTKMVHCGHYK